MNIRMLRRLIVLTALLVCLGWFSFGDTGNQVAAAPCCDSCPGFNNPGEEIQYCADQCGGDTSGSCYTDCLNNDVYRCYRTCRICGGGGGDECQFDTQCPPGSFCVGNHCS
jgi:hypothetical protein